RLYRFENGLIGQISKDNTEGEKLLSMGLMTPDQIDEYPERKAIYSYIGRDVELIPDVYEIKKVKKGTMLFLCSDGVSDVLSQEEMATILKDSGSTAEKGTKMVEKALEENQGFGDNITLIIIEY
nr:hypothetical protein [Lachnospiraceae bacterium]